MTDNPYKTTGASLVDPPEPALPARPRNVNIALALVGATVLISILVVLREIQDAGLQFGPPRTYLAPIAWCIFCGVVCHQVARARDWARLVLLIITVAAFLQLCWFIGATWRHFPEMSSDLFGAGFLFSRILPLAMNFVALHLLYFSSGDWFRAQSAPRDGGSQMTRAIPRIVYIALLLIGIVFLVEAFNLFRMLEGGWYRSVSRRALVIPIAQCVLLPVICYQVACGRRWARLLLLVLTLMAFAWFCWNVAYLWWREPEMWTVLVDPTYLARHVLPIFLGFAVLFLLYFRSGDFFGAAAPARQ